MSERIAVLGAGNIGSAMAADLSLSGHDVVLYEHPAFVDNIKPILYAGGIQITGVAHTGFARMTMVTTDIAQAVRDADYLLVCMVANAHPMVADMLAPLVRPGQIIVNFPGSAGSLVYARQFRRGGRAKDVGLADSYSSPYSCRKLNGPGTINVHNAYTGNLPVGVFPARETDRVIERLHTVIPAFIPFRNVLEITLYNPNILVHPVGTLLNVGRIEYSKGDFYLYREGYTDSVFAFLGAVDAEKVAVLNALGFEGLRYLEMRERLKSKPFHEFARVSSKGPSGVKDRYITEDVPNGLVFMASLASHLGVPTPNVDAMIQIFSAINGEDYRRTGRTVESVGMGHMTKEQILRYVETGVDGPAA